MNQHKLKMKLLKGSFGICRLDSNSSIPNWIDYEKFLSITKTDDELSIVCSEDGIPNNIKCEKNWNVIKVEGPLDFSLIGILSSISTILSKENISIFAISTYDTDYILVKNKDLQKSIDALSKQGYEFI